MALTKCKECGYEISKKAKNCPNCGACQQNKCVYVAVLILIIVFVVAPIMRGCIKANIDVGGSSSQTEDKQGFISSCKEYSYEEISRNPNDYVGLPAVFRGKVIQTIENEKNVVLRVDITNIPNEYVEGGTWDDTIYVEYTRADQNESRFLEGDIVVMYGTLNGIKNYENILGSETSIPFLKARYIELQ